MVNVLYFCQKKSNQIQIHWIQILVPTMEPRSPRSPNYHHYRSPRNYQDSFRKNRPTAAPRNNKIYYNNNVNKIYKSVPNLHEPAVDYNQAPHQTSSGQQTWTTRTETLQRRRSLSNHDMIQSQSAEIPANSTQISSADIKPVDRIQHGQIRPLPIYNGSGQVAYPKLIQVRRICPLFCPM